MISLTYLDRFDVKDEAAELVEPSGLALDSAGRGLWTVCDTSDRIFNLSLKGKLRETPRFKAPKKGLEGIACDPEGAHLYTNRETSNEIYTLRADDGHVVARRAIGELESSGEISRLFKDQKKDKNKGLEGIAWNRHRGSLFVLKEGAPGLIVEVDAALTQVRGHALLDHRNGFVDPTGRAGKVDYSGLCYDFTRALFWIVSDQARRV